MKQNNGCGKYFRRIIKSLMVKSKIRFSETNALKYTCKGKSGQQYNQESNCDSVAYQIRFFWLNYSRKRLIIQK